MGDGVDSLCEVVRVDLAPGSVAVSLAEAIEVAESLHTADVSRQQQVDQAVVRRPPHTGDGVQEDLKEIYFRSDRLDASYTHPFVQTVW